MINKIGVAMRITDRNVENTACRDSQETESIDTIDTTRRGATVGLLSAMGLLALSACDAEGGLPEGTEISNLTGTTVCWVDTIANLRSVSHPAVGVSDSKIALLRYHSDMVDRGGGLFYWDALMTDADNGGTIIRPNDVASGSAGRWRRLYTGAVNVRWFGARGDGSGNDRPAMRAAIDAAIVSACGEVYIPAGTYLMDTLTIDALTIVPPPSAVKLAIRGDGRDLTRITRNSTSATHTIDIQLAGASRVEICDLTIEGPTGLPLHNDSYGIKWWITTPDYSRRLRLERVTITGKHDTALSSSGGGQCEVIDCDLEGTDACIGFFLSTAIVDGGGSHFVGRGGIWKTPNGDLGSAGTVGLYIHPHITYNLQGVTFSTIGRYAIYQNGSWTDTRGPAVASGCRFIDCHMAQTKGNGVSNFVGCIARGYKSKLGSKLDGRVNISGCTFEGNDSIGYGAGTFSKVAISNCLFVDTEISTAGGPSNHWSVRDSTIVVTNAVLSATSTWLGVKCVGGTTELKNLTFLDETTLLPSDAYQYQTFIRLSNSAPTVRVEYCKFRNGRGKLTSGIYFETGQLTVRNCEFTAGLTPEAIWSTATAGSNTLDGEDNTFLNGAYPYVVAPYQQRLVRRRATNPNTVASATNINAGDSVFSNYDTHVVTGASAITSLLSTNAFVGVVRLILAPAAYWSTSAAGNITPKSGMPRTSPAVVELFWEPSNAKWLEI